MFHDVHQFHCNITLSIGSTGLKIIRPPLSIEFNYKISFLASIYGYEFTKRELDCIPLLLRGYTAKQIGESLNISFRTVEDYINQLKFKTSSRNELLKLLSMKFS